MLVLIGGIALGLISGRIDWHHDPLPVVEIGLPVAYTMSRRQRRAWRRKPIVLDLTNRRRP
jgi:hypothetical protein